MQKQEGKSGRVEVGAKSERVEQEFEDKLLPLLAYFFFSMVFFSFLCVCVCVLFEKNKVLGKNT